MGFNVKSIGATDSAVAAMAERCRKPLRVDREARKVDVCFTSH